MNPQTVTIEILGGQAPSGKWIFFDPKADLSALDETKMSRFAFEIEPQATRHSVSANGHVYEVLERLGLSANPEAVIAPGTYNAALRLTTALMRCVCLTTPDTEIHYPSVADLLSVPTEVLQQFQYDLSLADRLTKDDFAFFTKAPAKAAEVQIEELPSEEKAENEPSSDGETILHGS